MAENSSRQASGGPVGGALPTYAGREALQEDLQG